MDLQPELREDRRSRAMAATEILALALERNLPHMALAAAREAARSALLALAEAPPPRRLAGRDFELLKELAASSPQHMAGCPAERQALVRATLSVLDRVFLRPLANGRRPPRSAATWSSARPPHRAPAPQPSALGIAPPASGRSPPQTTAPGGPKGVA